VGSGSGSIVMYCVLYLCVDISHAEPEVHEGELNEDEFEDGEFEEFVSQP